MGEAFLRQHLLDRGVTHVEVASAGTHAQTGRSAMSAAQDAVRAIRGDTGRHVARQLDIGMAHDADLILCAAAEHRQHVLAWWPDLGAERVRLFNESIAGRAPVDVDDPYGWDAHVFMLAARVIDRAMDAWADTIAQRWPARS
jgi:protein-tyrosine phosphatase